MKQTENNIQKLWNSIEEKHHIIWDWNGTLLCDVQHAVDSMNHLLLEHNLPQLKVERYKQIFEFPVYRYYETLGFDLKKESFEIICEKFTTQFMKGFKQLPLMPLMQNVLIEIQKKSKIQSILSATVQCELDEMVQHFKLTSIFQYVFGINNKLGGSKIVRGRELINISGIPLSKTIIIGDTLHDLEVAHDLGIDAILLAQGHQCALRLQKYHDNVIELT